MSSLLQGVHECVVLVRPTDLDVIGHCNNARILEILETARWHWTDRQGAQEWKDYAPVIARVEVDFKREVLAGEVVVRTWIEECFRQKLLEDTDYKRLEVQQEILTTKGKVLVSAVFYLACIDTKLRRAVPIRQFLNLAVPAQML